MYEYMVMNVYVKEGKRGRWSHGDVEGEREIWRMGSVFGL